MAPLMRTIEELVFIRDRVLTWMAENPPPLGSLLGEPAPRLSKPCKWGHTEGRRADSHCIGCDVDRKRRQRNGL